jgi:hypothetical protein
VRVTPRDRLCRLPRKLGGRSVHWSCGVPGGGV